MKNILIKIIKSTVFGIAWGCTIFVFMGIIASLSVPEEVIMNRDTFIKQAICTIVAGIGFTIPAIIYENERVSRGLQIIFHMGIGLIIYIIVGFYAGWIPINNGVLATIITIFFMVLSAFIIWFGFFIYHKNEAKKINKKLLEKNQEK